MALVFPAAVKARLAASGSGAAVSLLEVLTVTNDYYAWSDSDIKAAGALPVPTLVAGVLTLVYQIPYFKPWLLSAGPFKRSSNTTTSSGQVTVQNLSGDRVRRDISTIFSQKAIVGALVYFRVWLADAEFATYSFAGSVESADIEADGSAMTLQLEGIANWAKIDAPYKDIGVSCPLSFGSVECGSTSGTPCDNSYGSCTSTERFQGFLSQWAGATLNTNQYVQPAPLRLSNTRVGG